MSAAIRQRTSDDCLICCIAMATGRTYEEVMAAAGDLYEPGKGTKATDALLQRLGLRHRQLNSQTDGDFSTRYRRASETPDAFRMQTWGRRAILCVPSLNDADADREDGHAVYWDGAQLHDPSTRLRYENWGDLKPGEITVFRETA